MAEGEAETDAVHTARRKQGPGDDRQERAEWDAALREATQRSGVSLSLVGRILGLIHDAIRIIFTFLRISESFDRRSIHVNHIYTTGDVAKVLGMGRRDVIGLIQGGKLKARKAGKNYYIAGSSIIRYFRG